MSKYSFQNISGLFLFDILPPFFLFLFQGCEKTAACAPPLNLIGCLLDVTQCSEVKPGGSCPVSCRFPYTGWSSVAVCRPDNVDSEVGLLVVEPECTLTCEDPPNEPEGYVKVNTGNGWACAPGYGGFAQWDCVIDSVCASKKVLSGCSLLARCILPEMENACMQLGTILWDLFFVPEILRNACWLPVSPGIRFSKYFLSALLKVRLHQLYRRSS